MKKKILNEIEFLRQSLSENEKIVRSLSDIIVNSNGFHRSFFDEDDVQNKTLINSLRKQIQEKDKSVQQMENELRLSETMLTDARSAISSLELELQHAQQAAAAVFFDKAALESQAAVLEDQLSEMMAADNEDACSVVHVKRSSYSQHSRTKIEAMSSPSLASSNHSMSESDKTIKDNTTAAGATTSDDEEEEEEEEEGVRSVGDDTMLKSKVKSMYEEMKTSSGTLDRLTKEELVELLRRQLLQLESIAIK
jgi:septal ring factor EnvC (AmiA/AmiB activator)